MAARFLLLTFLLILVSGSPTYSADPPTTFAPSFFAFENGVTRIGTTGEQIKVLKELGYDSLGSANPQNLPARLSIHKESGLKISSLYLGGKIGENKDIPTINPTITKAIEQLKGHDTIIELFVQGSGENTDGQAVAFVREVADLAKASGLRVVLYPHAGFYIDTLSDAVRIAAKAKRDNVGVMFNLCHFLKVEPQSDLRETLENAGDLLWRASTCGADSDGTNWGTLIQPLDKGSFDQTSFLRLLRKIGFSGDIGLQCYAVPGNQEENLNRSIFAWRQHLASSMEE